MKSSHCFDVVIVGAGASGLSCAATLLKQNVDLMVLEARPRIGGRVFTQGSPHPSIPIELGAEFIHAASPLILDLLKNTGHDFYDAQFEQLFLKDGKLVEQHDFWERFEKVLALADSKRKTDRSMAEFLKAHNAIPKDLRDLLIGYIEGFQAADINLIGEKAFAASEKDKRDLNGNNDFRIVGGYCDVLQGLMHNSLKKKVALEHPVTKITWNKKEAEVICTLPSGRHRHIRTRKVVLSVPLGVLQGRHKKSQIEFSPEIPELLPALSHLHVGHVQRMVFIFKSRFWENLSEENPVCFLRAPHDMYFSTWWTLSPLRAPYLIAWQGGPMAEELSKMSDNARIEKALQTLAKITHRSLAFLKKELSSVHQHNWSKDPYTMGAYTYTGVENQNHKPKSYPHFHGFLWLTGEAFAKADGQGTVHGALEHGFEVAQKILQIL